MFTPAVIEEAAAFADVEGSILRLAIRIETVEQLNTGLKEAMASRSVIRSGLRSDYGPKPVQQEQAFAC